MPRRFREVLSRIDRPNPRAGTCERVNGMKTICGGSDCTSLGHAVDGNGHKHTERRVEALQALQPPLDVEQLRSFVGHVQYLRTQVGIDAAALTKPLTEMTRRNVTFLCTAEHQECFEEIKRRILRDKKLAFLTARDRSSLGQMPVNLAAF